MWHRGVESHPYSTEGTKHVTSQWEQGTFTRPQMDLMLEQKHKQFWTASFKPGTRALELVPILLWNYWFTAWKSLIIIFTNYFWPPECWNKQMEQFRLKPHNQTQFKTLTHLQCKRLNSRLLHCTPRVRPCLQTQEKTPNPSTTNKAFTGYSLTMARCIAS